MACFNAVRIAVIGGGDLASGVIYRLHRAGFPVLVTELPTPIFVRRAVCYGAAIYEGAITVHGVTAEHVADQAAAVKMLNTSARIPVLIDPDGEGIRQFQPTVIVDGRMEKRNLGVTMNDAPLVIGLGPGFTAGADVHAVIETMRGHDLGRLIMQGTAAPDTGFPGAVKGKTITRILRAPTSGTVRAHFQIGDYVHQGDTIADVAGEPIIALFDGVLRGIVHQRVQVTPQMKIGDLDPRNDPAACFSISDKSLAVGGGVLEAVMASSIVRQLIVGGQPR